MAAGGTLMKWLTIIGGSLALALAGVTAHAVGNQELHKAPYDFLMGNHIDTHMENKLKNDGSLKGRLYIIFTGETDAASGLPLARHPRGAGLAHAGRSGRPGALLERP